MPDIIFLVGMHRSGTSALTRVLSLCGGALPLELLPPDFGNPSGYWEPPGAIEVNDALLKAHGSSWYDTSLALQTEPVGASERAGFIAKIVDFLSTGFGSAGPLLLKEPRITLFLPYWKAAAATLGMPVKLIHLFRNPFDVAASLAVRNQIAPDHSLILWLKYNLVGERNSRDCRRIFVSYEDLMSDWRSVVSRCTTELDVDIAISAEATTAVAEHLTPDLRHHRGASAGSSEALDSALLHWVQHAYGALAGSATDPNFSTALDAIFDEYVASAYNAGRVEPQPLAARAGNGTARRHERDEEDAHAFGVADAALDPHTAETNRLKYRLAKERYARELYEQEAGKETLALREEVSNAAAALERTIALQSQRETEHAELRDRLESENTEMRARLDAADVREAELTGRLHEVAGKANAALEQVYELLSRNHQASAELELSRAAAEQTAEECRKLTSTVRQLQRDSAHLEQTVNRLQREVEARETLIAEMQNSRSWRLTAPLRHAKRALISSVQQEQSARRVP